MHVERRALLSFLTASGLAVAAPKVEAVAETAELPTLNVVEPTEDALFVLTHPHSLSDRGYAGIRKSWEEIFAPHATPKLIILEEGMTLQRTTMPRKA